MKKSLIFIFTMLLCSTIEAQDIFTDDEYTEIEIDNPTMNIFRTSLSTIIMNNYSIQYERVLNKKFSVGISYRFMPSGSIPLKNTVLDFFASDSNKSDIEDVLSDTKISGSAITLEPRFYVGKKGYGTGFYIAPYYRYSSFKFDNISFNYESETSPTINTVHAGGKVTAHSGGVMIGAQWTVGKNFVIDWWIIGGHLGSSSGDISGTPNVPLTPYEQQEIRETIERIEFSDMIKEINVSANGVDVQIEGPWYGIRAFGVSLGYRF